MTTVAERFWTKVDRQSGECWVWLASVDRWGYGQFKLDGRCAKAHRVAYGLVVGRIPSGLVLDHLCRNHGCVNPDHLEPVTNRENVLRGESPSARQARQVECQNGHRLDGDNMRRDGKGRRRCRTCHKAYMRAFRERRSAPDRLVLEAMERQFENGGES